MSHTKLILNLKKLSGLTLAVFAVSILSSQTVSFAKDVKIGTVDMQHVLQTVEAGKKAKASLESTFNKRKKELQKKEAEIKKMAEKFQKKNLVMSEQARAKKEAEIRQKVMMLQQETAKSQQELAQREAELKGPIIEKIKALINDMAKKKGYTVVLEKNENSVLFSLDKDDLTKEVIGKFNKKFGKKLITS